MNTLQRGSSRTVCEAQPLILAFTSGHFVSCEPIPGAGRSYHFSELQAHAGCFRLDCKEWQQFAQRKGGISRDELPLEEVTASGASGALLETNGSTEQHLNTIKRGSVNLCDFQGQEVAGARRAVLGPYVSGATFADLSVNQHGAFAVEKASGPRDKKFSGSRMREHWQVLSAGVMERDVSASPLPLLYHGATW